MDFVVATANEFVGWCIAIGGLVALGYAWLSESGQHRNRGWEDDD